MAVSPFGTLPLGIPGNPVPYTHHIPSNTLHHLPHLVRSVDIAVPSYYNTHAYTPNGTFGTSLEWLSSAAHTWVNDFDWRAHEDHWNSFPNFKINVTTPSDNQAFNLHFAALFSKKKDAVPIILMHGWPGSWLEFVPLLDLIVEKYTPETLPFHVIVPSIPDYGLSTRSDELTKELDLKGASEAMNELMKALGFGVGGYIAQGGDVGYALAAYMSAKFDECKAVHLNLIFLDANQTAAIEAANLPLTPEEEATLAIGRAWGSTGSSYAYEHGTRPATIALAAMTSPLAMLSWMGEKFIEWSDNRDPLSLDTILAAVSFYWYTGCFGRALWSYRVLTPVIGGGIVDLPITFTKPFGYSAFPHELSTLPKSWADFLFPDNLVFYRRHDVGGHFAALQEPAAFLGDIEDFVAVVKTKVAF
ncbi:Alpha/Beta hydrolase protein [Bombardia bombarda]|uniref:Alpha/Beta hydrolase protein n=1 Tax=Bombardia bombarda TaxID=252184 RepID=A0AA39XCZ5_9PEZI|nr:Alpha/Beta hydrolase protein [Bombardia bombarda]